MSPHKKMFSFVLLAEKNNGTNHKIDVNQRPTKAGDHHYQILGTCLQDIPLSLKKNLREKGTLQVLRYNYNRPLDLLSLLSTTHSFWFVIAPINVW